ncbi:MAG: GMC family oxidoreductase [Actinobacteria bacterium]|nr:GMC family oxidoreductase [Actinomycetota bacterium]
MSVDAVVVGSGPAGSTVAEALTRAGWTVVIFEKGRNHLLDLSDPTKPARDFSNDEIKFLCRHFLGPDPIVEPRTFRSSPEDGERSHTGEVNSIPSTVGGGGTHADGKVPRLREEDFKLLSLYGPQRDASVADWPLAYEELEPFYTEAEMAIGVAGQAGANPFESFRSAPYPMPPGPPMFGATLSAKAAEALGYHPYPAPTAANSVPYGGRPACNNCGFCAFFGCPIHAKGDPVALLMAAMASGNAKLMPETFVSKILTNGRRATGVEFIGPDGTKRSMEARYVVLAAGAIETPRLLLLSGFDHPLIGRNLMVHFQTIVVGSFPMRLHSERGRAVTHVHDDHILMDRDSRAAAREAGLPWIRGGMVEHSGTSLPIAEAKTYPWGPDHKVQMRESPLRDHLWAFTMQGEDLAQPTNMVDLDPQVRDARGFPVARITYKPHAHEVVASCHHGPRLAEVLKLMGAHWTLVTTTPSCKGALGAGILSPIPQSRHVMGTVRMGENPSASVVDSFGRFHDMDNLVVADSSVFVTSAGYGPTLTLVALASRAAAGLR